MCLLCPVADSERHVRHGVGPERERRGHGEEDCPAGDEAGDSADQLASPPWTHQPGHQPAAQGLHGGAAPAVRQTQPRALAVSVTTEVVLHGTAHLLREQLESTGKASTQRLSPSYGQVAFIVKPYGFNKYYPNSDDRI